MTARVVDRGTGILHADMERIFQPFVTTKNDGLGLGLAICRTIVTAHGGRLSASNNDGPGATVSVTLPAVPAERPLPLRDAPAAVGRDDQLPVSSAS